MEVAKVFISGIISIGIITALVANGRQTSNVVKTTFSGMTGLLHTAETGQK